MNELMGHNKHERRMWCVSRWGDGCVVQYTYLGTQRTGTTGGVAIIVEEAAKGFGGGHHRGQGHQAKDHTDLGR